MIVDLQANEEGRNRNQLERKTRRDETRRSSTTRANVRVGQRSIIDEEKEKENEREKENNERKVEETTDANFTTLFHRV